MMCNLMSRTHCELRFSASVIGPCCLLALAHCSECFAPTMQLNGSLISEELQEEVVGLSVLLAPIKVDPPTAAELCQWQKRAQRLLPTESYSRYACVPGSSASNAPSAGTVAASKSAALPSAIGIETMFATVLQQGERGCQDSQGEK